MDSPSESVLKRSIERLKSIIFRLGSPISLFRVPGGHKSRTPVLASAYGGHKSHTLVLAAVYNCKKSRTLVLATAYGGQKYDP